MAQANDLSGILLDTFCSLNKLEYQIILRLANICLFLGTLSILEETDITDTTHQSLTSGKPIYLLPSSRQVFPRYQLVYLLQKFLVAQRSVNFSYQGPYNKCFRFCGTRRKNQGSSVVDYLINEKIYFYRFLMKKFRTVFMD